MSFDIGFLTALVWTAQWYLVHRDAGWQRRVGVTVGVVAGGALAAEAGRLLLFDHLGLNPLRWWWTLVLPVLAIQGALFVELLGHHLRVPLSRGLLAWGVILAAVAAKEIVCYHQQRGGLAAFAWHLATEGDLRKEKPAPTAEGWERAVAERDREMAIAMQGLKGRGVLMDTPAAGTPAPLPAAAPPAAALDDPGWETARTRLLVRGVVVSGRKTVLLVNDGIVEIGQCAGADYAGRHYTWKLMALNGGVPSWQPQAP